jgi:hypothetical protein
VSGRDPFIESMEREKQCGRPRGLSTRGSHDYTSLWRERPDELTQIDRLAFPKGALLDSSDRLQALLAAAYAQLMIHLEVKEER